MELEFQNLRADGWLKGSEASARAAYLRYEQMWRSRVRGVAWKRLDFLKKVEKEMEVERREGESRVSLLEEKEGKGQSSVSRSKDKKGEVDKSSFLPKDEEGESDEEKEKDSELDLSPEQVAGLANAQAAERGWTRDPETYPTPKIVAHRIYLPNIIVRLMRNFTPPEQPYDPYVATFRIPPAMTKTDLRSYLKAVYDLDISFIRTDLYWGEVFRDPKDARIKRRKGSIHNYKRAVVGLYEPFHYPDDVEELRAMGEEMGVGDKFSKSWEDTLDRAYRLKDNVVLRGKALMKIYKRTRKYRSQSSNAVGLGV